MTPLPQAIVATLRKIPEDKGRLFLQSQVPLLSSMALEQLVYYLKREADQCWVSDAQRSFVLSGYIMQIGKLTQNKYYGALGLMARGDALRRLDRDQEALPFFDAAGEEFLAIRDEVGWARTRIGRVNACLRLSRTTEALRDAARAHDIFMRHGKLIRAGQIDVNAAIIHFELGEYEQALRLSDRAIETYRQHGEGVALNIARAQGNKALALAAQGKFREAVALHEEARAIFVMYGEEQEIAVVRTDLNIASIYAAQGYYSRALLLYSKSRKLFQKHALLADSSEVAQQMCACLLRLNRAEDAYQLASETVAFFREIPTQHHNLARSLMFQADAATLDAPNFSFIKLADRQLSTIEVFNLDLSAASLVVLSACETGRSVVSGIDEVLGLGRGFLYAGAASLLPTLWKVDDASSAELMHVFYQILLQGGSKTVALSSAQQTFLARVRAGENEYRMHPYFWAAFHLIGDVGALV